MRTYDAHELAAPLFLALRQAAKKWTMPIHHWKEALNYFTILWPERMPSLERMAE
jgi:transposase-like protein